MMNDDVLQLALQEERKYLCALLSSPQHVALEENVRATLDTHQQRKEKREKCERLMSLLLDVKTTWLPIIEIIQKESFVYMDIEHGDDEKNAFEEKILNLRSNQGRKKKEQLAAILSLVIQLLEQSRTVLLRDVYYSHKHLFSTQERCNETILQLGKLLQLKRYQMNILPSAKGLIAGAIRFRFKGDQSWISCSADENPSGVLIDHRWMSTAPTELEIDVLDADIRLLIVLEKECIFHRLVEDRLVHKVSCILITGCGYPDVATRAAVQKISFQLPLLDVVGVCDYNPHGLQLLTCYRSHCKSTSFEAFGFQVDLKWLGLRGSHLQRLKSQCPQFGTRVGQVLSTFDVKRLKAMIAARRENYYLSDLNDELLIMLQGGQKFELEALYCYGMQFLEDYLLAAIVARDFIDIA